METADQVKQGDLLASLDVRDAELELAGADVRRKKHLTEADVARSERKEGEAKVAEAQAEEAAVEMRKYQRRIEQSRIAAPITGIIVQAVEKRQLGQQVKAGDPLFEITPLEALRAELSVPEDQIADVRVGQTGELASRAFPDVKTPFVVERINPVAEVVNQQNVFKVRVRLERVEEGMRPGLEGLAKVDVPPRRSYGWLWTHRLVNWVRMKLWL
jgi:multidrug resistance efflux pump